MKNRLFATIPLFVLVFLQLHILPPVLSNPAYRSALGQTGAALVRLAHHFGFAVVGVLLLLMSPKWRAAIVGGKRLLALLLPTLIKLLAPLPCQLPGCFVGGHVVGGPVQRFLPGSESREWLPESACHSRSVRADSGQNAVLSSTDGFSAPLLTMVGIMVLPIILTLGASLLCASEPMVQLLAFSVALMIALGIAKQRNVTA